MSSIRRTWPVVGVLGGCGGAGASALAAALAWSQAASDATPVLLDLDPLGGGIDILLGAEASPGARWSGLHATGNRLDPEQLRDGLPRWLDVLFLACDEPHGPTAEAVHSVIRAARQLGPTVLDLGRHPSPARTAALCEVQSLVLIVPGEIRAATAAQAQLATLADAGFAGETRLVVRLDRPVIGARRMAEILDTELAGGIGIDRGLRAGRDRGIQPQRLSRVTIAVTRTVMAGAASAGSGDRERSVGGETGDASTPQDANVTDPFGRESRSARERVAPAGSSGASRPALGAARPAQVKSI